MTETIIGGGMFTCSYHPKAYLLLEKSYGVKITEAITSKAYPDARTFLAFKGSPKNVKQLTLALFDAENGNDSLEPFDTLYRQAGQNPVRYAEILNKEIENLN